MPFVAVDAQCDVNLDVLDAATPFRDFPGELVVCVPGRAHAIIDTPIHPSVCNIASIRNSEFATSKMPHVSRLACRR